MVKFYIKSVTITSSLILVDYEIVLTNDTYEGVIGGGRTELPASLLESAVDSLRIELENHLENTVGMSPLKKSETKQEADPL